MAGRCCGREREHYPLALSSGGYRLETAEYAPDDNLSLLLHRLTWIGAIA
jgi:hypothetical protein